MSKDAIAATFWAYLRQSQIADMEAATKGSSHPDALKAREMLQLAYEAATPEARKDFLRRAWDYTKDFVHSEDAAKLARQLAKLRQTARKVKQEWKTEKIAADQAQKARTDRSTEEKAKRAAEKMVFASEWLARADDECKRGGISMLGRIELNSLAHDILKRDGEELERAKRLWITDDRTRRYIRVVRGK